MEKITLKISPAGSIQAETHGIKGKNCLNYIRVIEQLTGARVIDSDFTPEYRETPQVLTEAEHEEVLV